MRFLKCSQGFYVAPVAIDDLVFLPKTPLQCSVLIYVRTIPDNEALCVQLGSYMRQDYNTIFRQMDISLYCMRTNVDSTYKRQHRVFGKCCLVSPVCNCLWSPSFCRVYGRCKGPVRGFQNLALLLSRRGISAVLTLHFLL
jgi:hypothetical protein